MTVAIFGNTMKSSTREEVHHLLEYVNNHGVKAVLSPEIRRELGLRDYIEFPDSDEPVDFAVSLGGDGTFLTTAAAIGDRNIPILGINCGHMGFLAEVQTKDVDMIMDHLIRGLYTIEQRSVLAVSVKGEGQIHSPYALNEIAILKQGMSSMLSIDTYVNGEQLTRYQSDGLLIATPTGSTAYNMSIGGPLMVPQARGILLTPNASHSLNVRPLVIPDDWKIDLNIKSRNRSYMVSVDGRSQTLNDDTQLHIEKASYTIKVVQVGDHSFIQSLKDKLAWGMN